MYIIETEIRDGFRALAKTMEMLNAEHIEIERVFEEIDTLCVLGCGSSFSIAKSAATLYYQHTGKPAFFLPAGDLLVNFDDYRKMLKDSAVLIITRSGYTAEIVRAAIRCKEELGCKILSLCAKENSPVEKISDWFFCLPWANDEAVCQTRTVVNLYAAALCLTYIAAVEYDYLSQFYEISQYADIFCSRQEQILSDVARLPWEKAVTLGDSGMAGLMEEGSLAFKEICRRDSDYYHLLDVRHGPMVQIGADTLVVALLSSGNRELQKALLEDVMAKTSHVLVLDTVEEDSQNICGWRIVLPNCGPDEQRAVYALYCIQMICFYHAIERGVNPDRPEGLEPWIEL